VTVISHRGFWEQPAERNTPAAFLRSWQHGFGLETDVRDLAGRLVISHDPPCAGSMVFEQFLEDYKRHGQDTQVALNMKSDGLQTLLSDALRDFEVSNYFVFDMSIPDSLGYLREKLNVYTRQSELEPIPAFADQAAGVWLDMFYSEWPSAGQIQQYVERGTPVCLVSPELHKRSPGPFWRWLKLNGLHTRNLLTLCTDLPTRAEEFFYDSD